MTYNEFTTFVEQEMRTRWPRWDPAEALLEDWYAILRYATPQMAREAIQEHRLSEKAIAFEPKAHEVKKILCRLRKAQRRGSAEALCYRPYIRCLEAPAGHPEWEGDEWLVLDRFEPSRSSDQAYVSTFASDRAKTAEELDGGRWCGVVRPDGQVPESYPDLRGPEAKQWVEDHVRNGPDTAGRRFLDEGRNRDDLAKLPENVSEPLKTVASREMLGRLAKPAGMTAMTGQPVKFDPDNDPELDGDLPWERG